MNDSSCACHCLPDSWVISHESGPDDDELMSHETCPPPPPCAEFHHAASQAGSMVRREVPLLLVSSVGHLERSLADYSALQRILLMEEREAYSR